MNLISNIDTLTKIKHYDSLFIESYANIKRDNRFFKNLRPIYDQIDHIIQIIKSTFNREILLIHVSKINNISIENKIVRLRNAYNGVLNLLYYYNNYTNYGEQITELIKYLDSRITIIDDIDISEFKLVEFSPTNAIKNEEHQEESNQETEQESDEHNQDNSNDTDYEEENINNEEDDLDNSIYDNMKRSIYNGTNSIKTILVRVITSFIKAVRSIFWFF